MTSPIFICIEWFAYGQPVMTGIESRGYNPFLDVFRRLYSNLNAEFEWELALCVLRFQI